MTAVLPRTGSTPEDIRTTDDTDLRLWGVTTLIGILDKPALVGWAANQTASAAIRDVKAWQQIEHASGTDEARKWLAAARFRAPKTQLGAAPLGTVVHACCEEWTLTGVRPSVDWIGQQIAENGSPAVDIKTEGVVVGQMLDQFGAWLDRAQPDYDAAEITVYNPTYGYAGTCDGFLTLGSTRMIFDIKTSREPRDGAGKSKGPYPEVALQLAAYRHAECAAVWRPRRITEFRRRYYVLAASEREMAVPVPEVDAGMALFITPEACDAFPVRCDAPIFERFLHVVEVAHWKFAMEAHVIGAPLEFAERA